MKKSISNSPLILIAMVFIFFQAGCSNQPPANTSTNANMAVAEATPDKTAIEAELTRIENDWPRIIKDHDAATVRKIEADDALIVYPDGSVGNKDQDLKDIEAGNLSADSWEVSDINVKVLDNNAAAVAFHTIIKGGKFKGPDGQSMDISGEYRGIDAFNKRDGQWMLIATATVPVRNPSPPSSSSGTPKAGAPPKPSPSTKPSPAMKATPAAKGSPTMKPTPMRTP